MFSIIGLYRKSFSNLNRNTWILALAMLINRSGAMVLIFTSLYLTKNLHFSIAQAGVIMSFYGVGSILGSYAGGWLTDRRDHFSIMFYSLISSGSILILMLFASEQWFVSLVIFLYAFTSDLFRPANSAAIASYSTIENRTRSVSLIRLAINLGFSVGPAIGGFVAIHLGYHLLYIIDSLTSFAAAALLYFYLPRNPTVATVQSKAVLSDNKTSAYKDYSYLLFIFFVALFGICFFQLFATVPLYFNKECHFSEDTIGLLLALNGLLVVLIEMPMVAYLENSKELFKYIIRGAIFLPISFLVLKIGNGMLLFAIIYTFTLTFSEIFAMPFMMNYALSKPVKERQGQYAALYSIAYGISNILAPIVGMGIASYYGFDTLFTWLILLGTVVAVGFFMIKIKHANQQH